MYIIEYTEGYVVMDAFVLLNLILLDFHFCFDFQLNNVKVQRDKINAKF